MSALIDEDLLAIQEMREAVRRAKQAQLQYMTFSQEQIDKIVQSVADAAFQKSYELAAQAVEETGMGIVEHKQMKNEIASRSVYEWIKNEKTVGVVGGDAQKKIVEIAVPFGVVAAIIPTTNPTSSAIFKTLIALKTRNAIVASPHPSAVHCTIDALKICERAAVEAGAPKGLIGWLSHKSMPATQGLMSHRDTNLILATGGSALVRAAYSSGKPAFGVGPGNAPVYIEKTANVPKAVSMIIDSKSFDNGTICASEQSMVVDKAVNEQVLKELKSSGAYVVNQEEKSKLEKLISPAPGKISPTIVGKSAYSIAKRAGFVVDESTRVLVGEETEIGREFPLSLEKLAPVLGLYVAEDRKHAKELCNRLLDLGGRGHTLSIHTGNDEVVKEFSMDLPVSRILVNTLATLGSVGATTALAPSFTLGCGTYGGNITGDNITAKHLMHIKRVAYSLKDVSLSESESEKSPVGLNVSGNSASEVVEKVVASFSKTHKVDADAVAVIVNSVLQQIAR